jgi:penicillin-binding protein A
MSRRIPQKSGFLRSFFWTGLLAAGIICLAISKFGYFDKNQKYSQFEIKGALSKSLVQNTFPKEIVVQRGTDENPISKESVFLEYTIDLELQNRAETLLERYHPDYGAVAAIDAETGEILALAQTSTKEHGLGNLALRSIFPAASVFKIVTAAAAIDEGKAFTETVFPYNGRNHTLYKKNLLESEENRWTRRVTLREAFAKSINTVFGRLGIYKVGSKDLEKYAERFFFNKGIPSDLEIEMSQTDAGKYDEYELAEAASGFTLGNTLSPIHGAMLAGAIINEGTIVAPYLVRRATDEFNRTLYTGKKKILGNVMSPYSAEQMKLLMHETVARGTSRRVFRSLIQNDDLANVNFGGKTGSLTAKNPDGKCDWFVGYGSDHGRKIAIAVLTVHEKYWTVKSSYVAKTLFEGIFLDQRKPAGDYANQN